MLALSTSALVVLPYLQAHDAPPLPGLKPYTSAELRGCEVYIANGCVYCRSQQPRAKAFAPDFSGGLGRATVAGDYAYDQPHLLGTMRTGPDLMNIGVRQPSEQCHLGHLYQLCAEIELALQVRRDQAVHHLRGDAARDRLDEERHRCTLHALAQQRDQQRRHRRTFGEVQPG
jgi:hypothetical protein